MMADRSQKDQLTGDDIGPGVRSGDIDSLSGHVGDHHVRDRSFGLMTIPSFIDNVMIDTRGF